MWKFVLFDMDGTLIDSANMVTNRFMRTFQFFEITVPNSDELNSLVGPSAASTMEKYFPESLRQSALEYYRSLAKLDGFKGLSTFKGIDELTKNLAKSGKLLGVATSKPETEAIAILKHFGLSMHFHVVSGASDFLGIHKKQDVIYRAIDKFSPASLEDVVMVGDRIFDMEGATNCGIESVFVTWGGANINEALSASYVVTSPSELFDLINPNQS